MPLYTFECKKCNTEYDEIAPFDATGKYPSVKCPRCCSKKKRKLISMCQFSFTNPVGTDRWNSDTSGHDYRFQHNIPKVKQERETAERLSHMGSQPYNPIDDSSLDVGIHDVE